MVRRGPKRSVLCAQSEELHQKRACLESDARYGVGKFEREGGGSYFWKGGSRKGGFGRTPRTPPLVTGLREMKAFTKNSPFKFFTIFHAVDEILVIIIRYCSILKSPPLKLDIFVLVIGSNTISLC